MSVIRQLIIATLCWFLYWAVAGFVAGGMIVGVLLLTEAAKGEDNCRGFISTKCCCSNSCCWEITADDIDILPDHYVRIKASGQVVKHEWSQDGRNYRCACDYDAERGWVKHPTAHTRCVFLAPPSS